MDDHSPRYMAFLLRMWSVTAEDGVAWRASLEEAHTGERKGFAGLEQLSAFLERQCQTVDRSPARRDKDVE